MLLPHGAETDGPPRSPAKNPTRPRGGVPRGRAVRHDDATIILIIEKKKKKKKTLLLLLSVAVLRVTGDGIGRVDERASGDGTVRGTDVPNVSWNANTNDRAVFDVTVTEKVHGRTTFGGFRGRVRVGGESDGGGRGRRRVWRVDGVDGETINSSRRRSVRGRIGNKLLHERYFDGILVEIDEKSTERRRDELRHGLVWVGGAGDVYFGRHRAE